MEKTFSGEVETETTFHVVYQLTGDSEWYAAGDLNGYVTIEEARSVGAKERERRESGNLGPQRVVRVGFYERKVTTREVE